MKNCLCLFMLAVSLFAADKPTGPKPPPETTGVSLLAMPTKPPGTTEAHSPADLAEIDYLRAELAQARQELQIWQAPDVMRTRTAVEEARLKWEQAKKKIAPEKPPEK
jgi:hypothetical protein